MTRAVVALVAVLALVGCGDDGDDAVELDPATTTVEVRFSDSSVPPEYHRSFVLTADADEVAVAVDAYGEPIGDASGATPPDVWTDVVTAIEVGGDDLRRSFTADDGCAGGTSLDVTVADGGDEAIAVSIGACSDDDAAAARDAWGRALAPLAAVVDLDGLTDGRSPLTR